MSTVAAPTAARPPSPPAPAAPPKRGGFHYAWVVVTAAFLVGAINAAFMWAFTLIVGPVEQQFGWDRGLISVAFTLQYLIFALGSIGGGWLVDKIGARLTLVGGSAMLLLSLTLSSTVTELWQFYLYFGVLMGISRSAFIAPLHTVVSIWFRRRLGLAMGLVSASLGVGPLVLAPIMQSMIVSLGWQQAFFILGIVCGLIMAGVSLLIRNRPRDLNLLPYGERDLNADVKNPPVQRGVYYDGTQRDRFIRHARSTRPFYILIGVHFLGCLSHAVILAQLAPMVTGKGGDPALVATVVALVSGLSVLGYFAFSMQADKQDGRSALATAFVIQVAGILIMLFATQVWEFGIFALLFGLGMGGEMVVFPVINRQYYGNAPTGTLYGMQMFGAGIGMGLGGLLGGVLYSQTGNYVLAIYLAAGAGLLGVLLIATLSHPTKGLRARRAAAIAPALAGAGAAGAPAGVTVDPGVTVAPPPAPGPANGALPGPVVGSNGHGPHPNGTPGWSAWLAERVHFESELAAQIADWAVLTPDGELGEVLEIAAARARDRAFRLRRAGAATDALPSFNGAFRPAGTPDQSDSGRLERLIESLLGELPATPQPLADPALYDQMQLSLRETLDMLQEERVRLRGRGVRELPGLPANWVAGGQIGWKLLSADPDARADQRPAVLWVWQQPKTCLRWPAGISRILWPVTGEGHVRHCATDNLALRPGLPLEAGVGAELLVEATGDFPLNYLVVAPVPVEPAIEQAVLTAQPSAVRASDGPPAVVAATIDAKPAGTNGHGHPPDAGERIREALPAVPPDVR